MTPLAGAWMTRERLYVVQHLPIGTSLPLPASAGARDLLHELLGLPDDIDPVAWLARERAAAVARQALRLELLRFQSALTEWHATRQSGRLRGQRSRPYRNLLDVPADLELFAALKTDEAPSEPIITALVRQIRAYRGPVPGPRGLLSELLPLSPEPEPIAWVATNRAYTAALITIGALLDQIRPQPSLDIGQVLGRRRVRRVVHTPRRGRIVVDGLRLGSAGFSLWLQVGLRGLSLEAVDDVQAFWAWLGFGRVVDDQGWTYLARHRAIRPGTRLVGRADERITLVFYPEIAAGSRLLTLHAIPVPLPDENRWVHTDRAVQQQSAAVLQIPLT